MNAFIWKLFAVYPYKKFGWRKINKEQPLFVVVLLKWIFHIFRVSSFTTFYAHSQQSNRKGTQYPLTIWRGKQKKLDDSFSNNNNNNIVIILELTYAVPRSLFHDISSSKQKFRMEIWFSDSIFLHNGFMFPFLMFASNIYVTLHLHIKQQNGKLTF